MILNLLVTDVRRIIFDLLWVVDDMEFLELVKFVRFRKIIVFFGKYYKLIIFECNEFFLISFRIYVYIFKIYLYLYILIIYLFGGIL